MYDLDPRVLHTSGGGEDKYITWFNIALYSLASVPMPGCGCGCGCECVSGWEVVLAVGFGGARDVRSCLATVVPPLRRWHAARASSDASVAPKSRFATCGPPRDSG